MQLLYAGFFRFLSSACKIKMFFPFGVCFQQGLPGKRLEKICPILRVDLHQHAVDKILQGNGLWQTPTDMRIRFDRGYFVLGDVHGDDEWKELNNGLQKMMQLFPIEGAAVPGGVPSFLLVLIIRLLHFVGIESERVLSVPLYVIEGGIRLLKQGIKGILSLAEGAAHAAG